MESRRLQDFRHYMSDNGIDTALIQTMEDVYWLSGFNTPGAPRCQALIVKEDCITIHSRKLEVTNALEGTPISGYDENEDPIVHLIDSIGSTNCMGVQFETERTTPHDQRRLCDELSSKGTTLVDISNVIKKMRAPKSDYEIRLMQRAGEICVLSIKAAMHAIIEPDATEKTVAGAAVNASMRNGGEYTAYPPFIAVGKNSCRGHYACTETHVPITPEKTVFIELAGCFKRYHAAMMRTVYVGESIPLGLRKAGIHVSRALEAMRLAATPGATHADVRNAAHKNLESLQREGWILSQRTCYDIGIGFATDWGEIDNSTDTHLIENETLHILPWVRHDTYGAVGTSDTIIVRSPHAVSILPQAKPDEIIHLIKPVDSTSAAIAKVRRVFPTMPKTPILSINVNNLQIIVKDESHRLGQNSFKALGSGYALACEMFGSETVSFDDLASHNSKMIVFGAASDGNHGAGVAWAASRLGCKANVWLPKGVAKARINAIRKFGATVHVTDLPYDATVACATRETQDRNWCLVQDVAWEGYTRIPRNIMDAYMLIAHEITEQIQNVPTHILLQVGVGSFASAIVRYIRASVFSHATIIAIESEHSACLYESVQNGAQTRIQASSSATIAAGLDCCTLSDLSWDVLRDGVNFVATISDSVVANGVRLAHQNGIISGESGAAIGLGFLTASKDRHQVLGLNETSVTLVFNTEGVTDPLTTERILSEQQEGSLSYHLLANDLCLY